MARLRTSLNRTWREERLGGWGGGEGCVCRQGGEVGSDERWQGMGHDVHMVRHRCGFGAGHALDPGGVGRRQGSCGQCRGPQQRNGSRQPQLTAAGCLLRTGTSLPAIFPARHPAWACNAYVVSPPSLPSPPPPLPPLPAPAPWPRAPPRAPGTPPAPTPGAAPPRLRPPPGSGACLAPGRRTRPGTAGHLGRQGRDPRCA